MPRRVSLPGASELFRPTSGAEASDRPAPAQPVAVGPAPAEEPASRTARDEPGVAPEAAPAAQSRKAAASGRVRHDEKITVYVSRDELMALETGRLALRGDFGLAVDRGRIVRESIALAMADLERRGADSDLVRRLNGG